MMQSKNEKNITPWTGVIIVDKKDDHLWNHCNV